MKTEAGKHGDQRLHADDLAALKAQLAEARQDAREDYARAEQAESALVALQAKVAALTADLRIANEATLELVTRCAKAEAG